MGWDERCKVNIENALEKKDEKKKHSNLSQDRCETRPCVIGWCAKANNPKRLKLMKEG